MASTQLNRRRSSRIPTNLKIESINSIECKFPVLNVSENGFFIKTDVPYKKGSKFILTFKLPDGPMPISAYCQVLWSKFLEDSLEDSNGIGVKFVKISEFDQKRLSKFLQSIDIKTEYSVNSDLHTLFDFSNVSKESFEKRSKKLYSYINDMKEKGSHTYRRSLLSPSKNRVLVYDEETKTEREMVMMGSNNYLGMSAHPKVIKAAEEAIEKYGVGAGSVSLLAGTFDIHKKLEKRLAKLKGAEDAIIFPSGYSTNIGCISALLREKDLIAIDRLAHASIIDGCMLSNAKLRTFKHSDMDALEDLLKRNKDGHENKYIAVDGVYSMDGDVAPLPEIIDIANRYNAKTIVDDAHSTGVIGDMGKGTASHHNVEGKVDVVVGTLSKAIGQIGGFVASSKEIVNYLRYYARSYFFSTSLPPVVVASVLAALDVLENDPELHLKLKENINYFKSNLLDLGFETVPNTESAIIPIIVGEENILKKMSKRMNEEGVYVNPVPYPAVPRDKTRFRTSVMATHTREDLDFALEKFEKVGNEFGIINSKKHHAIH